MTQKTPLYRTQAKERARTLQREAEAAGKKLSYNQALVLVAKDSGYATVNEMTASYLPDSPSARKAATADEASQLSPHDPRYDVEKTLERIRQGNQETWPGIPRIQGRDTYGDLICDFMLLDHHNVFYGDDLKVIAYDHDFADPSDPHPDELEAFYGTFDQCLMYTRHQWHDFQNNSDSPDVTYWAWLAWRLKNDKVYPALSMPGTASHLLEVLQYSFDRNKNLPFDGFARKLNDDIERSFDPFTPAEQPYTPAVARALDSLKRGHYGKPAELFSEIADILLDDIFGLSSPTPGKARQRSFFADPREPTAEELRDFHAHSDGVSWGESPHFPRSDWQYEVENNDTYAGYWDWLASRYLVEGILPTRRHELQPPNFAFLMTDGAPKPHQLDTSLIPPLGGHLAFLSADLETLITAEGYDIRIAGPLSIHFQDPLAPTVSELRVFHGKHGGSPLFTRVQCLEVLQKSDLGLDYWPWLASQHEQHRVYPTKELPGSTRHLVEVIGQAFDRYAKEPSTPLRDVLLEDIRCSVTPFAPRDPNPTVARAIDMILQAEGDDHRLMFNQVMDLLATALVEEEFPKYMQSPKSSQKVKRMLEGDEET